jgi:hypothetical protein
MAATGSGKISPPDTQYYYDYCFIGIFNTSCRIFLWIFVACFLGSLVTVLIYKYIRAKLKQKFKWDSKKWLITLVMTWQIFRIF